MMRQCLVPNWNLKQQRKEQVEEEERSRSSHVHNQQQNFPDPATSFLVPMSDYEVAELIWENGQLSMHGLSGLLPTSQEKPIWSRARDTLESIVQQATCQYQKSNFIEQEQDHAPNSINSAVASSGRKRGENSGQPQMVPTLTGKRARSCSDNCQRNSSISTNILEECYLPSGCASASASASDTFCRDNDTAMMKWASLESGRNLKNKTIEADSACHCGSEIRDNQDEDTDTKRETGHSNSTRRNRTAAIHNQSERKRRDRINQKMKALQRLVPNASKTDKASMLDEVINYLKQLQAQIQMMSMRSIPQMMMPLAMQQHLQMSMLARMHVGLGIGMGMVNINNMAANTAAPLSFPQLIQPTPLGAPATAPMFVAPSFMMPSLIHAHAPAPPKTEPASGAANASIALPDPYSNVLTQSVNMDILSNMEAFYRQQMSQNNQALSSPSQPHHKQRDGEEV